MSRTVSHKLPSVPMPVPYGAHVVEDGVQFTLFSRHATRVWLLLFDAPDAGQPIQEFELSPEKNRIGDLWHIHAKKARPGQFYVYRLEGNGSPDRACFYNPHQWVLDPYALAVAGSPRWGDRWGLKPGEKLLNGPHFPKGVIVKDDFDWSGDRTLRIPLADTIIYETHVRGYTEHPSARVRARGSYTGLIEKIPYLQDLGVTAVELLPIHEFNEMEYFQENMKRKNLRNFWGYSTLAFFAPNGRYAQAGVAGQQVREFKQMVTAFHQAGIEVILDVVFNHTAEGGDGGPVYSFRGIDNSIYYMMDETGRHYKNFTGCGNTVNCNHPIVRDFIIDCLRYWVLHMHVDGFRFDLASVLTRGPDGEVLPNPSVVEHIAEDPALRETKLIAEAWDAAGLYQVGSFPSGRWSEWNGRYRDEIRQYWRGNPHQLRTLATRLSGSPDLYNRNQQRPLKSINFVTCHDGFTLHDVVSYNTKYNQANGEDNRDGENHNHSYNFGHEGPTHNGHIQAVRKRQMKNFIATVLLSQGVPMLLAGDEFGRTQRGNNNAYCQDNEDSWVDWGRLREFSDLHDFCRRMIAFRKAHPALRQDRFLCNHPEEAHARGATWLGPHGGPPDWDNGVVLGCLINGSRDITGQPEDDHHILALFNAGDQPVSFHLPDPPGRPWSLELSTEEIKPAWRKGQAHLNVDARSVNILTSKP
jgi:isoamylase